MKLNEIERKKLYKIEEIAPLLRVSDRTLMRHCRDWAFQNVIKIGNKWLISGMDIIYFCPFVEFKK